VAQQWNEDMTSKTTLTVAALLTAFSSMAVVGTANAVPRSMTEQSGQAYSQAYSWAAPASADAPDTHHYHGGPKAND
jgi:hypothetical protein